MVSEAVVENKQALELYVHIPFCIRKCHYCDFLSGPSDECTRDKYMQALIKEIQERSSVAKGYRVVSVFIGGGTPSVVNPDWIVRLLEAIYHCYLVEPDAEISMEVNPGTVDEDKLRKYRKAGINRLSIGLQSASDEELKVLGRIHTFSEFMDTYYGARRAGFTNLNVDLMSALPGQTCDSWRRTLEKVLRLSPKPEHISAYSLIIEEGTVLYRMREEGTIQLPDEDSDREIYAFTEAFLAQHGYERYEISNYALEGYRCRHNCGYWKRTEYLGLGLGAASLMKECRFHNDDDLQSYLLEPQMQRVDVQELTLQEQMEEFMFLGLRMMEGVSEQEFYRRFDVEMTQVYGEVLIQNINYGLLRKVQDRKDVRYSFTSKGIDVSNYVLAQFLL